MESFVGGDIKLLLALILKAAVQIAPYSALVGLKGLIFSTTVLLRASSRLVSRGQAWTWLRPVWVHVSQKVSYLSGAGGAGAGGCDASVTKATGIPAHPEKTGWY